MKTEALGKMSLPEEVIRQDRKKCTKYDQCGLGQQAVYMGSAFAPRRFYVPYAAVTHVFRRVGVSNGAGKGFLAPVLYLVVRYDEGKEYQCSFRYLQDADRMMEQLGREHPEISQLSPEGEKKAALRREREEQLARTQLSAEQEHVVRSLNNARLDLEKRPSLYERLAAAARRKRTRDLIRPGHVRLAVALFWTGAALLAAGGVLLGRYGGSMPILVMLAGAALMFMMFNTHVLPVPGRTRKSLDREYQAALEAVRRNLAGLERQNGMAFPVPAAYAHPVVLERMSRMIREGRADSAEAALAVLKEDLRAADSSVALSGRDYEEVVLIKPLFTVNAYQ